MFDIGFWELALIGIVALLVIGPEKMPTMIRTAGQWAGQIQRMARDLRREIEAEAQSEEYRALNRDFLAEDKRLKDLARTAVLPETPAVQAPGGGDETTATESKPASKAEEV